MSSMPMMGGPPPMGPPPGADGGASPSDGPISMYTSAAIHALHDAIAHEPDPQDKAVLAQCLQQILKVQAKNAQAQQQSGPAQALGGQLGGQ